MSSSSPDACQRTGSGAMDAACSPPPRCGESCAALVASRPVADLVALDLPGGPAFVDALRRAWDAGDAVCPIDSRLPRPAVDALFAAVAPSWVVGPDGDRRRLERGRPVEGGDALVVPTS